MATLLTQKCSQEFVEIEEKQIRLKKPFFSDSYLDYFIEIIVTFIRNDFSKQNQLKTINDAKKRKNFGNFIVIKAHKHF